ncbi:MAG: hypothetical protein KIT31_09190 [Deltaproteobacteria bacterium]|nr:hypothetical protein [Deltaproteobacteria bacterium]
MNRLADRTLEGGGRRFDDVAIGKASIEKELALCAGYFSSVIRPWELLKLQVKHRHDARWMLWGCYAGGETTTHGSSYGDADPRKRYMQRMNLGAPSVEGIAKEIARTLKVTCTAATGHGGTDMWHVEKEGKRVKLLPNTKHTKGTEPHWMWSVARSHWVTYDRSGKLLSEPIIYGKARSRAELTTANQQPPAWLMDLFYGRAR